MTFEEWYEENSDYSLGYIENVSAQRHIIAERAWNAAREDCARIVMAKAAYIADPRVSAVLVELSRDITDSIK